MSMPFQNRKKISLIAHIGIFITLALIFSYIEAVLPFQIGIPGVKIGLANFVILIALYYLGPMPALQINIIRILISGFLFTGVFGILYALGGGLLSLGAMILLRKTNFFSMIGVSVAGGVLHNIGQLLTAAIVMGTLNILYYFPVLLFSGIISGAIIGFLSHLIYCKLP